MQLIEYWSSPQITRLDGYGNGNRSLELTISSLNTILEVGFMANPTYEYGKGPINIKVVDPLNLANGYFECKFRDYSVGTTGNAADTASLIVYRYDQKGGNIIDSVSSERTIAVNNEQIIPEWGISVQIYQEKYYFPSTSGNLAAKTSDMIESSIEFADSSKRWLTGVQDNDAFFPTNWIRSGDYKDTNSTPNVAEYLNAVNYKDELGADPAQKYEHILDGTIAPHRLVGYQADYMPLAYFNSASASGASKATALISFLPSFNIIINRW